MPMQESDQLVESSQRHQPWVLFALSFLSLLLEVIIIRWIPSEIYVMGYYKNALLIAAFLGLGLGMLTKRPFVSLPLTAPLLLLNVMAAFLIARHTSVDFTDTVEYIWGSDFPVDKISVDVHVILALFVVTVVLLFLPLGNAIGRAMRHFKPLTGYSLNVSGSIAGIAAFLALSAASSPPVIWFVVVGLCLLFLVETHRQRGLVLLCFVGVCLATWQQHKEGIFWSPYSKIEIRPFQVPDRAGNPDICLGYGLTVNGSGHQSALDLSEEMLTNSVLIRDHQDLAVRLHSQGCAIALGHKGQNVRPL